MIMKTNRSLKCVVSCGLSVALAVTSLCAPVSMASASIADTLDPNRSFRAAYNSRTEVEDAAAELNYEIEGEGIVLLKNDGVLPMGSDAKVTVLGAMADTMTMGGAGSGEAGPVGGDNTPAEAINLFQAFDAAGIVYNPDMKAAYEKDELAPRALTYSGNSYDPCHYMNKVEAEGEGTIAFDDGIYAAAEDGALAGVAIDGYDTAVIVITRSGAEGQDNDAYGLTDKETGAAVTDNVDDHYLQLTTSEKELMAYAKANFSKIVVLVNSPSAMELDCLDSDEQIGAVLWIGLPGWNGNLAVADVLTGKINPSGRTVDIYPADFTTDPTWYNFGKEDQANYIFNGEGIEGKAALKMGYDEAYAVDGVTNGGFVVTDYAEGIYMGYRYYETVYAELAAQDQAAADAWYNRTVVYPFGYGLSYTTFTKEITSIDGDLNTADGEITVNVKVTNTGAVAGKDVVEVYSTAPYTEDEIEKAAAVLVGYTKTDVIEAGASADVAVKVTVKDLASFDYNDANGNDNSGYELEAGEYTISVRSNSHTVDASETMTVAETLMWDEDGNEETLNAFMSADVDDEIYGRYNTQSNAWTVDEEDHYLRRTQMVEDGVVALEDEYEVGSPNAMQEQLGWLLANGGAGNMFSEAAHNILNIQEVYGTTYYDYDNPVTVEIETDVQNPWVVDEVPAEWTQNSAETNDVGMYPIELADMTGIPLTDAKWTEFMNQLTWDELLQVVNDGGYGSKAIDTIGKPEILDHDGPGQLRRVWEAVRYGENGYAWAGESLIGSTWNPDLGYRQGVIVANEAILMGVGGWYGPGSNLHRSPLSGRNFEYYSQDGYHAGTMLAAVVKGGTDNGLHVYMKHIFLNDQETSRSGVVTFATEQAIREMYAKPFEMAVKQGNANGMMTAFNRIGLTQSGDYMLDTQMYRNEWGFDGIAVTDAFQSGSGWTPENIVRGTILPLNSKFPGLSPLALPEGTWDAALRDGKGGVLVKEGPDSDAQVESATEYYSIRNTATYALYTYANLSAMTGLKNSMLLKDRTVCMEAGEAVDTTVYTAEELAAFYAAMDTVYGAGNYDVTVSSEYEGLTYDVATGALTGTAPAIGFKDLTIKVQGKGNMAGVIGTTRLCASASAPVSAEVDQTYEGYYVVSEEDFMEAPESMWAMDASYEGKIIAVNYTAENLPEGLTIDPFTGVISGTIANPLAAGEHYEFTVTENYSIVISVLGGWWYAGEDHTISAKLYMTAQ